MGVHGLWKLLEPSGQMVPLESLAGKVLAVDVSIWLHQAVKGMHDAQGAPVAVAHLLILFHRLCKLLFYRIKPVFVFDGGVPALKRQTMAARRQQTTVAKSEAMKVREKLIKNLLKHEAVRQVLSNETASAALGLNSFTLPGPSVEEDLYKLPPIAADYVDSESSENVSSSEEENDRHTEDIHSIDVTSKEFLSLPAEIRHDILTELIDTRKQSSWKYLDNMPKQSDSFSDFQMNRLLKRRAVQTSLEKAGQEMGGRALSLKELESLLGDQGVLNPEANLPGKRIAQDSVTHFMLVQKNPSTEKKEVEAGGEKFDIMNHLEEVDWSSESDTDVILRKSPEKKSEKTQISGENAVVKVKTEPGLLSKQPKVRMTEEIADILSVLEDEDVACDIKVKVEDLQTKINVEDKFKTETKPVEEYPYSDVHMSETSQESLVNENSVTKTKAASENQTVSSKERIKSLVTSGLPQKIQEDSVVKNSGLLVEEINLLRKDQPVSPKVHERTESLVTSGVPQKIQEDFVLENSGLSVEENKSPSENQPVSSKVHERTESIVTIGVSESEKSPESLTVATEKTKVSENQPVSSKVSKSTKSIVTNNVPDTQKIREDLSVKEIEPPRENQHTNPEWIVTSGVPDAQKRQEDVEESVSSEMVQDASGSSSESESDFVTVTEPEVFKTPKDVPIKGNSKALTVTISPTKIGEDDIFADVFEPDSHEKTEEAKEVINEYKTEFQKEMAKGDIADLKKTLEDQQLDLMREQGKQERHASNPTDQMYSDAQEMLRLFGIPFVVAPMEAEAQCAALNVFGLTEGTITDDSDIWLFGGRVVYKNFFNQHKHVLEYRSEDIQKYFKLAREDLIKLALLVGSDYTVGLNGVGPVTALEILAAFRTSNQDLLEGLQKFRDWFSGKSKTGPPRATLKKKIRNTIISPGFPNRAVAEAYLHPQVDDSKEPFSWAKPDLDLIRKYVKIKMGWSPEKCNELLLPVMKKLEDGKNQHTMEKYFRIVQKTSLTEGMLSKRVESAIKRLGGDEETEDDPGGSKPKKKRRTKKTVAEDSSKDSEESAKVIKSPDTTGVKTAKSSDGTSKLSLINKKLHQDVKIPQKEMTQKMLENRKKQAIEIFRTYKKGGKKKTRVYAKEEAKLSESSSEDD